MKREKSWRLWSLAFFILLLDLLTKQYVHRFIPLLNFSLPYPYGGIAVFQDWYGIDFSINQIMNKGAAWGILDSFHPYLVYFRILIIGIMVAYLFFFCKTASLRFPLMLILTGAIGNVIDHFLYGSVVDMFYFVFWGYRYPLFNIADSSIFCGVVLIAIQGMCKGAKQKE